MNPSQLLLVLFVRQNGLQAACAGRCKDDGLPNLKRQLSLQLNLQLPRSLFSAVGLQLGPQAEQ